VGTRKVQDVLVDARVPRLDRPAVPVLEGGGAVIWIAGVARAGVAMVQAATREVVDAVVEPLVAHDVARLEGAW
jgi:tRNA(Ile)-lysidine synthase